MLDCHLCLWQFVRAVFRDGPSLPPRTFKSSSALKPNPYSTYQTLSSRRYATAVAKVRHKAFLDDKHAPSKRAWKESTHYKGQRQREMAEMRRNPRDFRADIDHKRLLLEMRHLRDPLELANRVRRLLQEDDESRAYALVRLASKSMRCTVGWNHLLDYMMSKSRVSTAIKAYNEMKKRAQLPDSHTFILLLRGLADHTHFSQSLGKALSLYHAMYAPNSPVKPVIKHTNVVLKVCARANDMDALWGVASKIPKSGPGAADNLTFTTILNALRQNAVVNIPHGLRPRELAKRRRQAVMDGRRIWEDVVRKWRQGTIVVDERLVCSMGRLLLISVEPHDWDDVLSLVAQTMNIRRLIPRIGTKSREGTHIPVEKVQESTEEIETEDGSVIESSDPRPGGEFDGLFSSKIIYTTSSDPKSSIAYARPGNNTLSLILEACLQMVAKKTAIEYWALLTDPSGYGVKPDHANAHAVLRVLRQARASTETVDFLYSNFSPSSPEDEPRLVPQRKTFRISMSACVRDKLNPAAVPNASAVLDLMNKTLREADPRTIQGYLELARSVPEGDKTVMAIENVATAVTNLRSMLAFGAPERGSSDASQIFNLDAEDRSNGLAALQVLIGCYDRVINRDEVPGERKAAFREQRATLGAFLDRQLRRDRAEMEGQRPFRDEKSYPADVRSTDGRDPRRYAPIYNDREHDFGMPTF